MNENKITRRQLWEMCWSLDSDEEKSEMAAFMGVENFTPFTEEEEDRFYKEAKAEGYIL